MKRPGVLVVEVGSGPKSRLQGHADRMGVKLSELVRAILTHNVRELNAGTLTCITDAGSIVQLRRDADVELEAGAEINRRSRAGP